MIKIKYKGPVGTHIVVSPKRQINSYGLHTRGDEFEVYVADQRARPDLFEPLEAVATTEAVETEEPNEVVVETTSTEDLVGDDVPVEETLSVAVEDKPVVTEPKKPAKKKTTKKH